MQRILLVKTSSLGDVVHNLPVVGDLRAALPDVHIDWVVEHGFSAIPAMHAAVAGVIPVSLRRWFRQPFSTDTRMEIRALRTRLLRVRYDAVIDTQGLLKSALIVRMTNGFSHGRDWRSSREPLALFYDKVHSIPWSLHAVERNRLLASLALGYPLNSPPDYGIQASAAGVATLDAAFPDARPGTFAVLLHATSAARKEWPEENWIGLGNVLAARGMTSVLPFGSATEQRRSERLAARIPGARVPRTRPRCGRGAAVRRANRVWRRYRTCASGCCARHAHHRPVLRDRSRGNRPLRIFESAEFGRRRRHSLDQ